MKYRDMKIEFVAIVTPKYWYMNVPTRHLPKTEAEFKAALKGMFKDSAEGVKIESFAIKEATE